MMARVPTTPKKGQPVSAPSQSRFAIFGPPPLIDGDDPAAYDQLLADLSAALGPIDIVDEIWVRDVVDLEWECLRLRRVLANLIRVKTRPRLKHTLDGLIEQGVDSLVQNWARQKPNAIREVDRILAGIGTSVEIIVAETLPEYLHLVTRIQELIATLETRRDDALREIDRRRANLGRGLRRRIDQLEATEYQIVGDNSSTGSEMA